MWSRISSILLFCMCVDPSVFSQRETMFLDVDAYQPVPSPDGKLIAYVLTGMKRDGFAGFGRSHLRSNVAFAEQNGNNLRDPNVEGFLGEWLPDSSAVSSYRDWRFSLVTPQGSQKNGAIPQMDHPNSPQGAERAQYIPAFDNFVWIDYSDGATYLTTINGLVATFDRWFQNEALIVPSPDGRYLAIGDLRGQNFWIYDIEKKHGKISDHFRSILIQTGTTSNQIGIHGFQIAFTSRSCPVLLFIPSEPTERTVANSGQLKMLVCQFRLQTENRSLTLHLLLAWHSTELILSSGADPQYGSSQLRGERHGK